MSTCEEIMHLEERLRQAKLAPDPMPIAPPPDGASLRSSCECYTRCSLGSLGNNGGYHTNPRFPEELPDESSS
jgi:hypothetical protein